MRLAQRISAGRMVVISLQGPYQFYFRLGGDREKYNVGFGWGTNWKLEESVDLHHRLIRRLIRLAVRDYGADPRRVFLLGFSQACSFNYRFMAAYPGLVRGVVAVCGGVPHEWHEPPGRRRAPTDVLHIAATNDEWYSREKNLEFRRLLAARVRSLDFRFYKSTHRFPRKAIPHIRRWMEKAGTSRDDK